MILAHVAFMQSKPIFSWCLFIISHCYLFGFEVYMFLALISINVNGLFDVHSKNMCETIHSSFIEMSLISPTLKLILILVMMSHGY